LLGEIRGNVKANYSDIRNRIKMAPVWFDFNGVPRYEEPHPNDVPNIYATQVVFYEIACQDCGQKFVVEDHYSEMDKIWNPNVSDLETQVMEKTLHYGDPPIHGCVGDTMNCDDLRVIAFWKRDMAHEWVRVKELEISLE
jgi:hypothetical protein